MPIYIIEHLEPELYEWCIIEYKNISRIVGKSSLWFTNIKQKDKDKLKNYGKVIQTSIKELNLSNACVLDPEAEKTLSPEEAKKYSYFIFGGILGDNPPRKRTSPELTIFLKQKAKVRNLGKKQFSTDNAVYVTKQITKGKPLSSLKFKNTIEIKINSIESTILPYCYPLINNKPQISKELIRYIKNH